VKQPCDLLEYRDRKYTFQCYWCNVVTDNGIVGIEEGDLTFFYCCKCFDARFREED